MKQSKPAKEYIIRQRKDRLRSLRVVKYTDYPFVLENCPVELTESYILADRETTEIFASFIFKNVSEKPITRLDIRLALYLNGNIPYTHIDFTYCREHLNFGIISKNGRPMRLSDSNKKGAVEQSECFGSCVYIPIPESYFKKYDILLRRVVHADGSADEPGVIVSGNPERYSELDNISKLVYTRVNVYDKFEPYYPTVVMPSFNEKAWLCCCGNKNPETADSCERCGREKAVLAKLMTSSAIGEEKKRLVADPREVTLHDKTDFRQNRFMETEAETRAKIEAYEKAMHNVTEAEKRRERRNMMLVPRLLAGGVFIALVLYLLRIIFGG